MSLIVKIPNWVKAVLSYLALFASVNVNAAESYLAGNIVNLSSVPAGLLVKLDSGAPANCASSPYGWMMIRAENKSMIALLLTMYSTGKKAATVYTTEGAAGGFCEVVQYDPFE